MNILVVGVVENSQVLRLRAEAEKRGHTLDAHFSKELTILSDKNTFEPTLRGKKLDTYDLIYILTVQGNRRFVWNTVCEYLKERGVVIVNKNMVDPQFHYNPNVTKEFLELTRSGVNYPRTVSFLSTKSIEFVLQNFKFPFILKSGEVHKGKKVFKVSDTDQLTTLLSDFKNKNETIVVREFIPNDGDIRVFTVGYKAIGAMRRIPKDGEFRSNISQGGTGESYDLVSHPEVREIAEKAAKSTNVEIAGVDVMVNKETNEPFVLEVNPGPQFRGFEEYTKLNAALEIIKYFETLIKK